MPLYVLIFMSYNELIPSFSADNEPVRFVLVPFGSEGPTNESAILHTEARDQVVETVVLSEDELEADSVDPTLTASAFAEPVLTAEDFDAFAPEPHRIPQHVPRGDK